jgi:fatty acid desaturase
MNARIATSDMQPSRAPADDRELLRTATELTRDIADARPAIYWSDMLASAFVGYAALTGAIVLRSPLAVLACAILAVLALYRALLFIHELTHIHRDALPGFRLGWNVVVGIPLLTPSLMYEGVHTLHQARQRYGTAEDPEYLPLALMKPWSLPSFLVLAALLPVALLVRGAVLVPLGALVPPLRRMIWQRASSLSINPDFRRRPPEGAFARMVRWQETGLTVWSITLLASPLWLGWRPLLTGIAMVAAVAVLNQLRTLVAHLWQNDGGQMTVTAQYLDTANVPPPGFAGELWAPVGLRYHATHHLLPSLPYHALPEAHRRLAERFGESSTYAGAHYSGMGTLIGRIARSTMGVRESFVGAGSASAEPLRHQPSPPRGQPTRS